MQTLLRSLSSALLVAACLSGCGDDSTDAPPSNDDAGSRRDSDSSDPVFVRPPSDRDSGTPSGSGSVGQDGQCVVQSDCIDGLNCVSLGVPGLSLCAEGCTSDADCGGGLCVAFTNDVADAHCVNAETEEFAFCGPAATATCARGRTCLLATSLLGTCVDLCELGDGDGGMPDIDPEVADRLVECQGEATCLDVLADAEGVGACLKVGARGDDCALGTGVECDLDVDICSPADASDPSAGAVCAQDCTERDVECDTGTCMDFQGAFAYCQ